MAFWLRILCSTPLTRHNWLQHCCMAGINSREAMNFAPARALGMRTCFLNTDGLNETPECDLVCEGADYEKLLQMILPGAASDGAR